MENRPLEKLVLPVRKSLRWRLPGRFRAVVARDTTRLPEPLRSMLSPGPYNGQRKGHRASAPAQAAERGGLPPVGRAASPRFSPIGSAWPLPGGLRD